MNQLFIVCPFSHLELPLTKKYGNNIFFLTAAGGALQYQDNYSSIAVRDFLEREDIKNIYVVNDMSCRFINNILKKEKLSGLPIEEALEEIYVDHYFTAFKDKSLYEQQKNLAELNVRLQIINILGDSVLGNFIVKNNISVTGLVISKEESSFSETFIQNHIKHKYEL